MKLDEQRIKQVLLDGQYLEQADIFRVEEFAKLHEATFADSVVALGLLNKDLLGKAVAESYNTTYVSLLASSPDVDLVTAIPEEFARKFYVIAAAKVGAQVTVASANPEMEEMRSAVQSCFPDSALIWAFTFPEEIEKFLLYYRKPLSTRFAEIIAANKKIAPEITEEIIRDALDFEASDIHFEPQEREVQIRFRVDGMLYPAGTISREYYTNILNRIKVLAQLRVDEHNTSQDGAIRHKETGRAVDIRISIIPTIEGEKVVMRILSRHVNVSSFLELGLSATHTKMLTEASKKPSGMIILAGPTGSGKTTTLYTIVNTLNSPEINITTIEDPVEYKMRGINQIQVNLLTNLTFANGLRSIVRQDPNVILVGEIRDKETAEISTNAALTGHLVLSSFHAIDTASAITRLLHMEVEPTVLASTLELMITQRLVRKICESCRTSQTVSRASFEELHPSAARFFFVNDSQDVTLFHGSGCKACSGFGYSGRTGIFEFLPITTNIREAIVQNPSLTELRRIAKEEGVQPMFADGVEKVRSGATTIEELLRVASPLE